MAGLLNMFSPIEYHLSHQCAKSTPGTHPLFFFMKLPDQGEKGIAVSVLMIEQHIVEDQLGMTVSSLLVLQYMPIDSSKVPCGFQSCIPGIRHLVPLCMCPCITNVSFHYRPPVTWMIISCTSLKFDKSPKNRCGRLAQPG